MGHRNHVHGGVVVCAWIWWPFAYHLQNRPCNDGQ
jgi:hypothetical protein